MKVVNRLYYTSITRSLFITILDKEVYSKPKPRMVSIEDIEKYLSRFPSLSANSSYYIELSNMAKEYLEIL